MTNSLKKIDDYIEFKNLQINHTPFEKIEIGFGKHVELNENKIGGKEVNENFTMFKFTIDKQIFERLNRSIRPNLIEIAGKKYECYILDLGRNHLAVMVQNYDGDTNKDHKARFLLDMSFIFKKQKDALEDLKIDRNQYLRDLVFGDAKIKGGEQIECTYENKRLNESQKIAISYATGVKDIYLIWGPPGTGKTTIVPEIIRNYFKCCIPGGNKQIIIVCGWTNTAIDNIVQKLCDENNNGEKNTKNVIRYGGGTTLDNEKYEDVLYVSHEKRCIDEIEGKYGTELTELNSKNDQIYQKIKDSENQIVNLEKQISELKEQSDVAIKDIEHQINLDIKKLNVSLKSFFEKEISEGQKQIKLYTNELANLKIERGNTLKNIEELNEMSTKYESIINDSKNEISKLKNKESELLDILDIIEQYLHFIKQNKIKYLFYLKGLYSPTFLKKLIKYELHKKDYDSTYIYKTNVEQNLITLYSKKSDVSATISKMCKLNDTIKKGLHDEEKTNKILEAKQNRVKQEIEKKNEESKVLLGHLVSIKKAQLDEMSIFEKFYSLIEVGAFKNHLLNSQKNIGHKRTKINHIENKFISNSKQYMDQVEISINTKQISEKEMELINQNISSLKVNKENELENITSLILNHCDVIATTIFETSKLFKLTDFDLTIMDEAGAVEVPNALIPMIESKKVILLGDHKQLQPIIREDKLHVRPYLDKHKYMKDSIFKLLISKIDGTNNHNILMLDEQYRMQKDICNFVSQIFYDGELKASNNLSSTLSTSSDKVVGAEPQLVWFLREYWNEKVGKSYRSRLEVELIINIVNQFKKEYGNRITNDIAVITPFAEQSKLIKDKLPEIECGTVHKFQGQQSKIIIFSPAESSQFGPLFLGDIGKTLLNVAVSRAQEKFIIIGSDKIKKLPNYKELYKHIAKTGWISDELTENYDPNYKCPLCGIIMYNQRYEFCRECGEIKKLQNRKFNEKKIYKCNDGDMVRSNGEVRIDDWLSENKIEHIYEQKLPISHLLYCDWYLPKYNVYIEFWGSIHSIDEGAKRKYKEKVYKKNGFKLINIENDDLLNLNDRLNHELGKL